MLYLVPAKGTGVTVVTPDVPYRSGLRYNIWDRIPSRVNNSEQKKHTPTRHCLALLEGSYSS